MVTGGGGPSRTWPTPIQRRRPGSCDLAIAIALRTAAASDTSTMARPGIRALAAIGPPGDAAAIDALHDRFRERYAGVPCRFSAPYPGARDTGQIDVPTSL